MRTFTQMLIAFSLLVFVGCDRKKSSDGYIPSGVMETFKGTWHGVFESNLHSSRQTVIWIDDHNRADFLLQTYFPADSTPVGLSDYRGTAGLSDFTATGTVGGSCPGTFTWNGQKDENGYIVITVTGSDCRGPISGQFRSTWK